MDNGPSSGTDAYAPAEIARRVEETGVRKARLGASCTLALAVLAGAFIALGAFFSIVAATRPELGYGPVRILAGCAFSLGLILVVVGGAELFTGNNLVAMAWASRRVTTAELFRNWVLVYAGNLVGAASMAWLVAASGACGADGGAVGETALAVARKKAALAPAAAFVSGILCNILVCLAVWLCFGARSVADKILAIVFPVTAFVAAGFEHCVANMFFLPLGMILGGTGPEGVSWAGAVGNLVPVTAGNLVGGGILVAGTYWFIYLRPGACR